MKNSQYHVASGQECFFEYHCWEDEKSSDAKLWHRTHQRVVILSRTEDGGPGKNMRERIDEDGFPAMFKIRFADGFEAEVFEDELLLNESEYEREPYNPIIV